MEHITVRGLRLSRMTLGTVQLGMAYGVANRTGQPSRETAFEMLRATRAAGVNSIDTARAYGTSEDVIGDYRAAHPEAVGQPVITTKFKLSPDEPASRDSIERQIRQSAETSMQKLGLRSIPILMSHAVQDLRTHGDEMVAVLDALRREGLIERAGASVYTADDLEHVLAHDIFEAVQIPMNMLDPRIPRSGMLERLAERDIIVFVRSVFLQGLIFLSPDDLPDYYAMVKGPLRALRDLSTQSGLSLAQLAVAYIRDLPGVSSLVLGAETPEQVRANAELLACTRLDEEVRQRVERISATVPIEDVMKEIMQESTRNRHNRT